MQLSPVPPVPGPAGTGGRQPPRCPPRTGRSAPWRSPPAAGTIPGRPPASSAPPPGSPPFPPPGSPSRRPGSLPRRSCHAPEGCPARRPPPPGPPARWCRRWRETAADPPGCTRPGWPPGPAGRRRKSTGPPGLRRGIGLRRFPVLAVSHEHHTEVPARAFQPRQSVQDQPQPFIPHDPPHK